MKKFVSLFSGIGGFELGLRNVGFEPELLCDIDVAAQKVLSSHFSGATIVDDVCSIEALPKGIDLLTAGFPCQDLSSVGQKAGIEASRSGLVSHVFRLIRASRPKWVIIENVYFMLHLSKGAGIRRIVEALEGEGYRWAYRVLDSIGFGLPQRRRRVFIVASLDDDPSDVLFGNHGSLSLAAPSLDNPLGFYWTEGTYATGLAVDAIPPLKGGSTIGIPSPPAILMPDGFAGTPDIRDAEALQGFPRGWTDPALEVGKASLRWRLVGNAVPVNVVRWLAQQLKSPTKYDHSNDVPFLDDRTWPDAAWGSVGHRATVRIGHFPAGASPASIRSFIRHDLKPLSSKATWGFLKRARKGRLRFPEGFLGKLDKHAEKVSSLSK